MDQLELAEHINKILSENPVLDRAEDWEALNRIAELKQRFLWMNNYAGRSQAADLSSIQDLNAQEPASAEYLDTLEFSLKEQLEQTDIDPTCKTIALHLISMLDDRGFLNRDDYKELRRSLKELGPQADKALEILQSLEPSGIGAFDLSSCLLLQLKRKGITEGLVCDIARDFLDELAEGKIRTIAKRTNSSSEEILRAKEIISSLEPSPASFYTAKHTATHYIIPDAYIVIENGKPQAVFSETCQPELSLNPYYLELYAKTDDPETKIYLKEKIKQAKTLQNTLLRRKESFRLCLEYIMDVQKDFFTAGEALRPLMQNELAAFLGVNPSTVSRMLRNKYVQCARGTFPLSHFICRRVHSINISPPGVMDEIRSIIAAEDKSKPLSDERICQLLEDRGIPIRRRTVAKYRSELGIPRASERKRR